MLWTKYISHCPYGNKKGYCEAPFPVPVHKVLENIFRQCFWQTEWTCAPEFFAHTKAPNIQDFSLFKMFLKAAITFEISVWKWKSNRSFQYGSASMQHGPTWDWQTEVTVSERAISQQNGNEEFSINSLLGVVAVANGYGLSKGNENL